MHDKKRCGEAACRFAAIKPIMRIAHILFIMALFLRRQLTQNHRFFRVGKFCNCLLLLCVAGIPLNAAPITPIKSLYSTLDPLSVSEHLAFYELYPTSTEGQQALSHAWMLLNGKSLDLQQPTTLPKIDIQAIISLITRQPFDNPIKLQSEELALIEKVSARLHNRQLKGSSVWTKEEVLCLPADEIDLSRGLLIFQFDGKENSREEIRHYEATIDIMALQIAARLPSHPSDEDKIHAISNFIFYEMGFRFPPHSLYAKDIDLYTFLPSVLDNRRGVCLGVSILYLSLAQRLNLPLEIITPPGHIYVRYHRGNKLINIETTARGINLPSETYLGINTRQLQQRTMKEVIGFAFMNQASVFWTKEEHQTAVMLYEKARLFLPEDPLLKMLLGYNYLFVGRKNEGVKLLKELQGMTFEESVSAETIPDDFINGKIDAQGIKAVFLPVDETRESIQLKQQELQTILKRYPNYRAGLLQMATTWLQLGRGNEAKEVLERYHKLDSHNATTEYYLAVLNMERHDFNRAWLHLQKTEDLVHRRAHQPKALLSLRNHLRKLCPEPLTHPDKK